MCASGDMIGTLRFTKASQGRLVDVRISNVEDLASCLHWLPWRGIKSQPGWRFFFLDETNCIVINIGQADDEKSPVTVGTF